MIGSSPESSAMKAQKKTTDSTKMKCAYFSSSRRVKNQEAIRGTTKNTITINILIENASRIQSAAVRPPCTAPEITANRMSTAVSVRIVPPTVMATASFLEIPRRVMIG
jgi:hypothetical protein